RGRYFVQPENYTPSKPGQQRASSSATRLRLRLFVPRPKTRRRDCQRPSAKLRLTKLPEEFDQQRWDVSPMIQGGEAIRLLPPSAVAFLHFSSLSCPCCRIKRRGQPPLSNTVTP